MLQGPRLLPPGPLQFDISKTAGELSDLIADDDEIPDDDTIHRMREEVFSGLNDDEAIESVVSRINELRGRGHRMASL